MLSFHRSCRSSLGMTTRRYVLSSRIVTPSTGSIAPPTRLRAYKSTLSSSVAADVVSSSAESTTTPRSASPPPSSSSAYSPRMTQQLQSQALQQQHSSSIPVAPYDQSIQSFPSLIIGPNKSIQPIGSFAQAQAMFLQPDPIAVQNVAELLQQTNSGIVAHYYMDVELQGVLQAVSQLVPGRVGIADSLKMGDMAVEMASTTNGVKQVMCLGVDFMAESVQAILQQNQFAHIPVYRAAQAKIGCSLAESAERSSYRAWLQQESSKSANALHVVYINTSLETKAVSSSIVPTITCTSSNVLATILQAYIQIPNLKLLYGPDTYMGENLITLLAMLIESWDDDRIKSSLHPQHSRETLQQLKDSIVVYPSGNCVVHHMFGQSVVDTVKQQYQNVNGKNNHNHAYVTAHLEVPGEMFEIAMSKSLTDDGVVGSTSDILKFITRKVEQAATSSSTAASSTSPQRLKFILGTEAGMVTSIVQNVQQILDQSGNSAIQAEIIFPVSSEAIMSTDDDDSTNGLAIVPGVGGGEGCSVAGGCATCPFMKMNNLDALIDVLEQVRDKQDHPNLLKYLPPDRLRGKTIHGTPAVELGTQSIQYMRHFMQHQQLPHELVQKVLQQR